MLSALLRETQKIGIRYGMTVKMALRYGFGYGFGWDIDCNP